jgi:hypothetical protein
VIDLREAARDVRAALADPARLCGALGLKGQRQAGGMIICCPAHGDRTPSCSVTRGPDGTARVRCFACDFTADALGLVAAVYGLPIRGSEFRETLATAAELGGMLSLADELRGGVASPNRERPPPPTPEPERDYPPTVEVDRVWQLAGSVADDVACSGALVARRIDPEAVAGAHLARALVRGQELPAWARRRGQSWWHSGHRMIVRVFDASGALVGLRAWRVEGDDPAKRLPPAGHRSSGLVLANRVGRGMLLGSARPRRLVIVEGEPDWLVWSLRTADAVIGIGSGWWTDEHAARVPPNCEVIIRTHADEQGERYAEHVAKTIGERCEIWRAA